MDLNRHVSKGEIKWPKGCSTSLIREMQIKITMQYHRTLIKMASIKNKQKITSTGEQGKNGNPHVPLVGL